MAPSLGFQTEIEFELPKGYLDEASVLHRRGTMRLATAADEILPLRDPRVQQNEAYLAVIVLSRVITRLGSLVEIHPGIVEGLYSSDMAYLQRLYDRFNSDNSEDYPVTVAERSNGHPKPVPRRFSTVGEA